MKIIFLTLLAALLAGCAGTRPYPVKLESDPPGARVFLSVGATARQAAKNRSYLGQTPCTVEILGDGDGYFELPKAAYVSSYVAGSATFIAEPPSGATNLFPKSVTYRGKSGYQEGDRIPAAVFFDLHKR